jgi:UDP-2,3-diacylglucosamine hydrolase
MKANNDPRSPVPDPRTVTLEPGAWLIADAHYAHYQPALHEFLSPLTDEDLPPQLFLMGDIFDLLFGNAPNSIEPNRKMVDVLERISQTCEVVYLEGNHDFGLEPIFGDTMRIVRRSQQPLYAECGGKRVALHHGDILQGIGYEVYTALIRNPLIDRVLNRIDTFRNGAIIGWLEAYNRRKEPCYRIGDFDAKVRRRMEILSRRYDFDIWVEGHFHQDVSREFGNRRYVNLPSFACTPGIVEVRREGEDVRFVKKKL